MTSYDIAVVGGGVVGLSIALELAQRSDSSIVLFDKGGPGAGTSGRSAGVICRHEQGPLYIRLSLIGHQRIQQFKAEHGLAFHTWGALSVVREPAAFPVEDEIQQLMAAAPSGMYEREELGRDALLARYPWLRPEGVVGGYLEPNIGFIDPLELVNLYRRLLAEHPRVTVMDGTHVLDMTRDGDTVTSLATRRGRFGVGTVVNAAGPWGAKVAALAGTPIALTPQRVQVVLATTYDEADEIRMPLTGGPALEVNGDGVWCRGEIGGGTLFGSHRDTTRDDEPAADPDHFDTRPDAGFAAAVQTAADTYYRLPRSTFYDGWTCVYGTTADGFPIVSRDTTVTNLYHALGMNGHGMTIHAGVARAIGRLVLDGSALVDVSDVMPWPETLDLGVLDVGRFAKGELVPMMRTAHDPVGAGGAADGRP